MASKKIYGLPKSLFVALVLFFVLSTGAIYLLSTGKVNYNNNVSTNPSPTYYTNATGGVSGSVVLSTRVGAQGTSTEPTQAVAVIYEAKNVSKDSGESGRGNEITRVKTDANGKFSINLDPGTYELVAENLEGTLLPAGTPQRVTVENEMVTGINLTLDSGMR